MASDVFQSIEVKEIHRRGKVIHIPAETGGVGTTAGWNKANNTGTYKLPASQTGSTVVIPLELEAGTVIKSFIISGQLESAGNAVTLDADLRVTTAAAAALTDASLGAITQISKTADYKIADEKVLAAPETVVSGKSYYILLAGTTAAVTDIDLQGAEVTVDLS